ncbi:MAG: hypothetical protein ACO29O_02725 [Chitinophagaceae bacterium]
MSNRSRDELFQLIKTLGKAEKRNFKLFIRRNSSIGDMKIIMLFDAIDQMEHYDEDAIIRKNPKILRRQLSNLKAHLFKQILASLRVLRDEENIDMHLHELMDHARILYNKGLYGQSLKMLGKMKDEAREFHQATFWLQALIFEKKIESLHITRSFEDRAEQLSKEVNELETRLKMINKLSNLALQMYGWYIKLGHARDEKDVESIKSFFEQQLPEGTSTITGFYERLYLAQCQVWYGFILQDFIIYYKNCQRWVDLFQRESFMIPVETLQYIKGLHNLLNAHFILRNRRKYIEVLHNFEEFSKEVEMRLNTNNKVQAFVYLYLAKVNLHFLEGSFSEGLNLIPVVEGKLIEYEQLLDRHRVLIFYYKFACLYFGTGDFDKAIDYLNKIIHWKVDLRTDLHCYARLLHLIAHYELGNYDLLGYLIRSVYRFMSKMQNLSVVEKEIFRFLRLSIPVDRSSVRKAFEILLNKLKRYENNPLESRSFMYLDIISWLESKMEGLDVQDVIRKKASFSV